MPAIAGTAAVGVPAIGPRGGTCCITQPSKVGRSGAMPGEAGNEAMSLGRHSIDDGEAGVDRGAVLGIDGAVDRRREHDAALFLQPDEGLSPGGIVGRDVRACDGDEPSAFGKTRQGRSDVPQCCLSHLAIDMNRGRERWVHQHDARHDAGIEVVVDVRGVEPGRGDGGKKLR